MDKVKTKHQCEKCQGWFSAKGGNYSKHLRSCSGIRPSEKNRCPYCDLSFEMMALGHRANHARWCDKNPKKSQYLEHASGLNLFQTNDSRRKAGNGIRRAHASGLYDYKGRAKKTLDTKIRDGTLYPSEETRSKMRRVALLSARRRLQRNPIDYNGVLLDSSWELALAMRLDVLGIKWIRPDPIKWQDRQGYLRNYFPDFYLPDHDLYLDPKNPFAIKVQAEKLGILLASHNNIIILDSLDKCKVFDPANFPKS